MHNTVIIPLILLGLTGFIVKNSEFILLTGQAFILCVREKNYSKSAFVHVIMHTPLHRDTAA